MLIVVIDYAFTPKPVIRSSEVNVFCTTIRILSFFKIEQSDVMGRKSEFTPSFETLQLKIAGFAPPSELVCKL